MEVITWSYRPTKTLIIDDEKFDLIKQNSPAEHFTVIKENRSGTCLYYERRGKVEKMRDLWEGGRSPDIIVCKSFPSFDGETTTHSYLGTKFEWLFDVYNKIRRENEKADLFRNPRRLLDESPPPDKEKNPLSKEVRDPDGIEALCIPDFNDAQTSHNIMDFLGHGPIGAEALIKEFSQLSVESILGARYKNEDNFIFRVGPDWVQSGNVSKIVVLPRDVRALKPQPSTVIGSHKNTLQDLLRKGWMWVSDHECRVTPQGPFLCTPVTGVQAGWYICLPDSGGAPSDSEDSEEDVSPTTKGEAKLAQGSLDSTVTERCGGERDACKKQEPYGPYVGQGDPKEDFSVLTVPEDDDGEPDPDSEGVHLKHLRTQTPPTQAIVDGGSSKPNHPDSPPTPWREGLDEDGVRGLHTSEDGPTNSEDPLTTSEGRPRFGNDQIHAIGIRLLQLPSYYFEVRELRGVLIESITNYLTIAGLYET
uniref:Uncharacterized protein n=1 Tax=Calla Lily Valley virus TaxID=3139873 RepID=A0AAN0N742_9VIRU